VRIHQRYAWPFDRAYFEVWPALRTVPRPDGSYSYRIDGRIFKAVRDDNDQQDRGGKQ
jgi:hypothetical protein